MQNTLLSFESEAETVDAFNVYDTVGTYLLHALFCLHSILMRRVYTRQFNFFCK